MVAIRAGTEAFAAGLHVLSRLTRGTVNLCTSPEWDIPVPDIDGLRVVQFSGPHPAGLPGTHIHYLYPVSLERVVWHIGYQDVIAIGKLFRAGVINYQTDYRFKRRLGRQTEAGGDPAWCFNPGSDAGRDS